ncbi:MAG TPA: AbrB/MazE/SpoVT family DNA-binding domain-containing protein [Stellaceae bacterium]|nr:AbrB/MazE/SpoVT family DNA-binding domain-containing protein [Stellaceae bacterium]
MRAAIRKLGNSSGVIIPRSLLSEIGVSAGDAVEMSTQEGRLVLAPVKRPARTGWASASATVAALGDDELAWPEFGNIDDEALVW